MKITQLNLVDKNPPIQIKLMWYMEDCFSDSLPTSDSYIRPTNIIKAYDTILESIEYIKKENETYVITFKGLWNMYLWQHKGKVNDREIRQAVQEYNMAWANYPGT